MGEIILIIDSDTRVVSVELVILTLILTYLQPVDCLFVWRSRDVSFS